VATLERAIEIAIRAHKGQVDKAGRPYILHPIRLMLKMDTLPEMIAAVLHDTVEDSDVTLEMLAQEGFAAEIVEAVRCLTRRPAESYERFILRAKGNPIARNVKRADLEDNMNVSRLDAISQKDFERLRKYHEAWRMLAPGGD